ncbi:RBBP9/YdeN family alpha/beta hydrolase [Hymenobacter sp. BT491]|uniref:RBBP9/YdeN family alpha/beta hydrolase n=1 Tax=Hymenobacter sp. BT491 TaxID=2766779 RepID=UPI001653E2E3|nr:alpha/beta fold hydrolase [Hymenobacter sp. BT491]MBC6991591.1 alpha/beta hydrolase [Hymenobacter sp. BT491]
MEENLQANKTKQVYVVPRWGGSPSDDWYPWLKQQLESSADANYQVHLLNMPAWDLPVIERANEHLAKVLPPEKLNGNVYLVGHSVGCLAILHYLAQVAAQYSKNPPLIGGVLCVAGWFSVDSPWQDILNWIHAPIDYEAARQLIPENKLTVLLSDDDPYTSGFQENERLWVERLHSNVSILAGRQHFSSQLDSDVLDAIRDLAGTLTEPADSVQV